MPADPSIVVRLNDLNLTRAAELTAVLLSRKMGCGETRRGPRTEPAWRAPRARLLAACSMFTYLNRAHCSGTLVKMAFAPQAKGPSKAIWRLYTDRPFGARAGQADWSLEFVICPVDGARDLLKGLDGGSIAVLAGGPPGSFVTPQASGQQSAPLPGLYFVIGLTRGTQITAPLLPTHLNIAGATHSPVVSVLQEEHVSEWLEAHVGSGTSHVTVAGMEQDQPSALRPWLADRFRVRTLHGSTVAAATAVLCSRFGIDAFVGVVGEPQLTLIATAAQALDCRICAFPVSCPEADDERRGAHLEANVLPDTPVYTGRDFVADKDIFFIATGITENLLVRGVRFPRADLAETQTLVLRSLTRSSRYISTHHALDLKELDVVRPTPNYSDAEELVSSIRNYVNLERGAMSRRAQGESSPIVGVALPLKTNALLAK